MLPRTLSDLQRAGYIRRTVLPTKSPSVEYSLSPCQAVGEVGSGGGIPLHHQAPQSALSLSLPMRGSRSRLAGRIAT
jgi:hypothetical protein